MFTYRNIAEATDTMFSNVNIAMKLKRIPHNKNVPPKRAARHLYISQLAEVW